MKHEASGQRAEFMRNIWMKPLSHLSHLTGAVVPFLRRPVAATVLFAGLIVPLPTMAERRGAPGETPAVPSAIVQQDRAFLESVAAGETGPAADVTTPPKAVVRREMPPQVGAKEEGPPVPRTKQPARSIAEKPAPAPAPIASRTKPKTVKREAPAVSARETEPRGQIASSRSNPRATGAPPIKPFFDQEEAVAAAPAAGGSRTGGRTRVTAPSSARNVEVQRVETVDRDDDGDEAREGAFLEPRSRRHGFFHRLFHGDD
jgi:hypothetical protein